ncbi:hypothetical protein RB653_004555 [Dictyostelium firmibasis]|uniref:Alkaline phosphatase n=1 Tax=Dictyostelium firmibasis TaxID=79012 RepID=A0AAN7Z3F5_9MYCE
MEQAPREVSAIGNSGGSGNEDGSTAIPMESMTSSSGGVNGGVGGGNGGNSGNGGKVMSHFLLEEDFDSKRRFTNTHKRIFYILTSLAILVTVVLLIVFLLPRGWKAPKKNINIIMMIGDGMGPAALTMARVAFHTKGESTSQAHLQLDPFIVGSVKTYSSNSVVTDSAAAATAYASGVKTYNNAVGVDENAKPVGTIIEAAKKLGMKTGLVVTTRISDATPACYFAHSASRHDEGFIIDQLLEREIDVILGGGKQYFSKQTLQDAVSSKYNYTLVESKQDMEQVESGRILGLFADYNIPWEIDRLRDPKLLSTKPSLQEMTIKALDLISQNSENGFFLMVEGSKIDVAAHINDAPTQIWETDAFDQTFKIVREWAENDGNTIVIVTADHETGGLTLANQMVIDGNPKYSWSPEKLLAVNKSADVMAELIKGGADPSKIIFENTGIKLTVDDLQEIGRTNSTFYLNQVIGRIVSNYADIGFTTGGHTGEDVNLYTFGDKISEGKFETRLKDHQTEDIDNYLDPILRGNINNIDIASFIIKTLNLDIQSITKSLESFNPVAPKP